MRQVHFLTHLSFMFLWNEFRVKGRVNWRVQIRSRMLKSAQNWTAINIVKQMVVVIGLVWEPSVIQKDILQPLSAFCFWCNLNRRSLSCNIRGIR
jgi:hypothetical protein